MKTTISMLKQKNHSVITLDNSQRVRIKNAVKNLVYPNPDNGYEHYIMNAENVVRSALSKRFLWELYLMRSSRYNAGTLLVKNMPLDNNLPLSPIGGKRSNYIKKSSIAETALIGVASILGFPIGHEEEKDGHLIHDIVPVHNTDKPLSNEGSIDFGLHVENAIFKNREKFLILYCLRPDPFKEAITPVADVRLAIKYLSTDDIAELRRAQFVIRKPYILDRSGTKSYSEPVSLLEGPLDCPTIRGSFYDNGTKATSKGGNQVLDRFKKAMNRVTVNLKLDAGDMVIINNSTVMHGRKAFRTTGKGNDRHLIRSYIMGDLNTVRTSQVSSSYILKRSISE